MQFLDPEHALRQFGVYGREHVGDFGAGSGFFSLAALDRLEGGVLYAIDADTGLLDRLSGLIKEKGHNHGHLLAGDIAKKGGVPLADKSLDKVILSNVLFQIDDRDACVDEVRRVLKDDGKVLVIDWHDTHTLGPKQTHRICRDDACVVFTKKGFVCEKDIDAGECHYGMILRKES